MDPGFPSPTKTIAERHASGSAERVATEVISWSVLPGHASEFEDWAHELHRRAAEYPGHLGASWLRPSGAGGTYQTVLKFSDADLLTRWMSSSVRAEMISRLHGIATEETTSATGLETWFSLPDQSVTPPPKWKMAVVTFSVIWPLSIFFNGIIAHPVGHWPLPVRAALFPLGLVPLLTFVIMPRVSKLLRKWLYG